MCVRERKGRTTTLPVHVNMMMMMMMTTTTMMMMMLMMIARVIVIVIIIMAFDVSPFRQTLPLLQ